MSKTKFDPDEKKDGWTRWIQWNEICRAYLVMGDIKNYNSGVFVARALDKRVKAGLWKSTKLVGHKATMLTTASNYQPSTWKPVAKK